MDKKRPATGCRREELGDRSAAWPGLAGNDVNHDGKAGRKVWFTLVPMAFLLFVSVIALLLQLKSFYDEGNWLLPVWMLLQPRDYINGLQLFVALLLLLQVPRIP